MNFIITYEPKPKQEETSILWQGLSEFAKMMRGHEPGKAYAFFIRNKKNEIKGGCSGYIFYGSCYIDLLWLDDLLRNQGYGTQLMRETEKLATENQCHFITVSTMDWEAYEFYKKLGFYVEFERGGYDKNSTFYYFRKDLN